MFFESFLINFFVILVLLVALTFDYITKFFSYWYIRHVPYKTCIPFFGSDYHRVLGIRSNTEEVNNFYENYPKEKFAGAVKSRIPDLIVRDPDAVKRMLSTDFANFHSRGLGLDKSQDVCLRNNLFYADGEKWTLLRRGIETLIQNMEWTQRDLNECLPGTNGDVIVQHLLSKVLDLIFNDLLLDGSDASVIRNLRSAHSLSLSNKLKTYLKNVFPLLYELFGLQTLPGEPSKETQTALQGSKLLGKIKQGSVFQMGIKEKDRRNTNEADFAFSSLAMFINEGYLPCLYTLTSMLYELAKYPEVQKKVRQSIGNNEDYLDAVVKESLRLHPAYSVISRQCVKMYQYPENKLVIDKKVTINVPVEAIHRDEKYHEKPTVFNPERFLSNYDDNTYLPFGLGPRKCVGDKLSQQIIKDVARSILKKYEVSPCDKTPASLPVTDHNFGRAVAQDVWLRFRTVAS
ncbi:cytochrome P450 6B4-like [Plodia interpunctella]|uniref:cytochrome P450 6B4-like n=1 Tax=Plodia interpunctella TaxID=58824 RepID=UPI002368138E|nr:cytochrome P450 6B4-like [Plodia interpunctella]